MRRVALLVVGSRALDPAHEARPGTAESESWARSELARALAALPRGSVVLTTHDERGPAAWVLEHARAHRVPVVQYDGHDGERYQDGQPTGPWWIWTCARWPTLAPGERLQALDEALLEAVADAEEEGWKVEGLALAAAWAPADRLWELVGEADLRWVDLVALECPMELGQKA